ncbi:MAG: methyltransferase domain-containing protein [Acidobacteriota bacterium]|nr:methyltransferase domain-containing protein [Acidobacteriota bacterium]
MSEAARHAPGHYEKKQLLSKDRLIAWSHRSRFETGLRLARRYARGGRVLDYGCGDGTFLAMLSDGGEMAGAVGAEVCDGIVEDCRRRLGARGISFVRTDELDAAEHAGGFDLVVCMEVLEHVVDEGALVERLGRLAAPGGRILISVPVETGLPLVVKQAARRVAGWRGIGDYPGTSPYTFGELLRGVFAGRRQHMARPVHRAGDGAPFHDHKGFNWVRLRETLAARFRLERTLGSPVAWLPPHLASQVWFVLRKW